MAATTTLLGLVTPTQGTLSGTWGDTVNYGISDYVDISVAGTLTLTNDGAVTLANTTGSSAGSNITSTLTGAGTVTAQFAIVRVTGTLTVAKVVTGPSYSKTYTVVNAATGGIVTFKASGQTGVSVAVGESAFVYFNGTDYVKIVGTATAGAAGGSTTQVQYNNAGVLAGITGATTNGTALTLVAPVLGTPASATLTNATGLPISTGVSGLGSGVATFLATPSSANLASAVTDETGSGALVFATSPTLVTPALGTPSSGVVTNLTGTASININGTVGATTATTGAFTTLTASSTLSVNSTEATLQLNTTGQKAYALISGGGGNLANGYFAIRNNTNSNNPFYIHPSAPANCVYISSTGLSVTGALTTSDDASIYGLTVGRGAGAVATNTAVGASALAASNSGTGFNTGLGNQALLSNTTGALNTAVGAIALQQNTTGSENTAVGQNSLPNNTTGSFNTTIGRASLVTNSTGANNTALGYSALYSNTTASNNTAVGYQAGYSNTTGFSSTYVGYLAGFSTTTGVGQVAMGNQALYSNTTGTTNTALGGQALYSNTTANNNTAVGYQAGYNFTTSNENTVIGYAAGKGVATGQTGIVCLGAYAGAYQRTATGSGVILIGAQADVASAANSFEIVIGYNTEGKGSSTGFINANGGGNYQGNNSSSWSTTSDQRLKKNIVDNTEGLDIVSQIRVRNFEYRTAEEVTELPANQAIEKQGVQLGVIAQELQAVCSDCVKEESTGVLSVDASNLTWHMINAIKELKAEFDAYKATHP